MIDVMEFARNRQAYLAELISNREEEIVKFRDEMKKLDEFLLTADELAEFAATSQIQDTGATHPEPQPQAAPAPRPAPNVMPVRQRQSA